VSRKDGYELLTKSTAVILVTHFNHKEQQQHICCSLLFSSLLQEDPTKLVGILFVKAFSPLEVITQTK
jgi:hypothetical protein